MSRCAGSRMPAEQTVKFADKALDPCRGACFASEKWPRSSGRPCRSWPTTEPVWHRGFQVRRHLEAPVSALSTAMGAARPISLAGVCASGALPTRLSVARACRGTAILQRPRQAGVALRHNRGGYAVHNRGVCLYPPVPHPCCHCSQPRLLAWPPMARYCPEHLVASERRDPVPSGPAPNPAPGAVQGRAEPPEISTRLPR
jgi:hypothetical protein